MLELSAAAREHFTHPRHAGQWLPETPGDIALAQRIVAQLDAEGASQVIV